MRWHGRSNAKEETEWNHLGCRHRFGVLYAHFLLYFYAYHLPLLQRSFHPAVFHTFISGGRGILWDCVEFLGTCAGYPHFLSILTSDYELIRCYCDLGAIDHVLPCSDTHHNRIKTNWDCFTSQRDSTTAIRPEMLRKSQRNKTRERNREKQKKRNMMVFRSLLEHEQIYFKQINPLHKLS